MESQTTFVEVSKLKDNPFQPRKKLSSAKVVELANSIREAGLIQAICVRQVGDDYQIICGHRRVAAYRLLDESASDEETRKKYSCIRAEVRNDLTDASALRLCLAENLQRDDLEPLEAAEGLSQLQRMDPRLKDTRSLGAAVGISHSKARRFLQLASAPPYLKAMVEDGAANEDQEAGEVSPSKLSAKAVLELIRGHESLASIPGLVNPQAFAKRRVTAVMNRAIKRQWSCSEIAKAVKKLTGDQPPRRKKSSTAPSPVTNERIAASVSPSSTVGTPSASGETAITDSPKKSARPSLELAWEIVVLGVVIGIAGGFLQPAIVSTVVGWIGTAISLAGIALLARRWAPLHRAWTNAFELGVAPLLRELKRAHSQAPEPKDASKPASKKVA